MRSHGVIGRADPPLPPADTSDLSPEPKVAVCPGSYDPYTRGHMGVAIQAINMLDKLVIAVGINPGKDEPMFSLEERQQLIIAAFADFAAEIEAKLQTAGIDPKKGGATPAEARALQRLRNGDCEVVVEWYTDLTIDCAMRHGAHKLIRGLRLGDFANELKEADDNRRLAIEMQYDLDTIMVPAPDPLYMFTSSTTIHTFVNAKKHRAILDLLYPSTAEAVKAKVVKPAVIRRWRRWSPARRPQPGPTSRVIAIDSKVFGNGRALAGHGRPTARTPQQGLHGA
jgi:pantetheine-phosphate adenylyltransferase